MDNGLSAADIMAMTNSENNWTNNPWKFLIFWSLLIHSLLIIRKEIGGNKMTGIYCITCNKTNEKY